MNKLIKKQELLLAELEGSIKNYGDQSTKKTKTYTKKRIQVASKLWKQIEVNHDQILANISVETPSESEIEYFKVQKFVKAEESYLQFVADLEESLDSYSTKESPNEEENTSFLPPPAENATLKLPRITLPKFSGDYSSWISFRDLFISLIHNKQSLTKTEKLHYLKASLGGEAEQLVQGFAVTESNYEAVWNILSSRYENKRMLVYSQFDIIFNPTHLAESSKSIKKLLDSTIESVQALANMKVNNLWDVVLVYITTKKLPRETLQLWEQQVSSKNTLPDFETLQSFLETRFRTLEAVESAKTKSSYVPLVNKGSIHRQSYLVTQSVACAICGGQHIPKNCENFIRLSFSEKNDTIKRLGLCINCLKRGHRSTACPSRFNCNHCGKRHHTLMHIFPKNADSSPTLNVKANEFVPNTSTSEQNAPLNTLQAMHANVCNEVLLGTALVLVKGPGGHTRKFRALLDPGSQASFVTEHVVQSLYLKKQPVKIVVSGIGQSEGKVSKSKVLVDIVSADKQDLQFEAFVLKSISNDIPSQRLTTANWNFLQGLQLADPTFNSTGKVDILVGADVYGQVLLDGIRRDSRQHPIAVNTTLGWVICGKVSNPDEPNNSPAHKTRVLSTNVTISDLNEQLQNFWKLEDVSKSPILSPEHEYCENHFKRTHSRSSNGTYTVRLPFKNENQDKKLGQSRDIAMRSLYHLERKFLTDGEFKTEYSKCLNEYIHLNHMQVADSSISNPEDCFYLPHHAVFKDSTSTKLRIVFDASRKTSSGFSLNDVLMTGPALQRDLIQVFLQWRQHRYSFIADIEKMYRQVKVHPEDINFQRILWRDNQNEDVRDYCLNTVTFGVTCAPFLAIRVIKQLAQDESETFPIGSKAIQDDMYVDDLLSGEETIENTKLKMKEVDSILRAGSFELKKWMTNNEETLQLIPPANRAIQDNVNLDLDNGIKSLGLLWFPKDDTFGYKININLKTNVKTKRELLSTIAKIYDPLGCISPLITTLKILMQAIWIQGVDWDEQLPPAIQQQFNKFMENISQVEVLRIPRWLHTRRDVKTEVHAFCDASQRAYAAVLYVRTEDEHGKANVRLLLSKSKVAPVKPVSIPRLELCSALLAAKLIDFVKPTFTYTNAEIHLWSDSKITLSWLNSHPSKWNTFISNRTCEILDLMGETPRHYVPTSENPADLPSRGIHPHEIIRNDLWWLGPAWLSQPKDAWPKQDSIPETDMEKRKLIQVNFCTKTNNLLDILTRFSSLLKLYRVTAYCLRVFTKRKPTTEIVTSEEICKAQRIWIKYVQQQEFFSELKGLEEVKQVDKNSKLISLYPFLDNDGIIRVGGRLQNTELPYDERHPIILPKSGHYINLVLDYYHRLTKHGGSQLMLSTIRKRYWILDARNSIRHFIHKCVICYRYKAKVSTQLMGNLPDYRVTKSRAFTNVGVDYCGPITLKMHNYRGSKTYKGYIAIFVCLAVKAVHIEPVSDMTSNAFISAFQRFTARRGLCKNLYSDCGTNFVGANAIFKEINERNKKIAQVFPFEEVNWHFIPPASPHFGGIWESAVKSVKYHLKRIVGNAILTFEELCTTLYQVEACMNSRPLCPLSSSPDDLIPLTPGHFLIGDSLLAPPQNELTHLNENRLSRWQLVQQLVQHLWNRWSREYIHQLQQRTKWQTPQENVKLDSLVIVKEDHFPPNMWPLGRIVETHCGKDGLIRVVTVRMQNRTVKRPLTKIALLPIENSNKI